MKPIPSREEITSSVIFFLLCLILENNCVPCMRRICELPGDEGCVVKIADEVTLNKRCADDAQCNTLIGIFECTNTSERFLPRNTGSNSQGCLEDTAATGTPEEVGVTPGFYIIEGSRFCTSQCIDRLLLRSDDPTVPGTANPIQFHVYKRYVPTNTSSAVSESQYFVEQQTFNVTLRYRSTLAMFEATPTGASVCVETGDYIGFTLSEGLQILGNTSVSSTSRSYFESNRTQCTGIPSSRVFDVNPVGQSNVVPLIIVENSTGNLVSLANGEAI